MYCTIKFGSDIKPYNLLLDEVDTLSKYYWYIKWRSSIGILKFIISDYDKDKLVVEDPLTGFLRFGLSLSSLLPTYPSKY